MFPLDAATEGPTPLVEATIGRNLDAGAKSAASLHSTTQCAAALHQNFRISIRLIEALEDVAAAFEGLP